MSWMTCRLGHPYCIDDHWNIPKEKERELKNEEISNIFEFKGVDFVTLRYHSEVLKAAEKRIEEQEKWLQTASTAAGSCDLDQIGNVINDIKKELQQLREENERLNRIVGEIEIDNPSAVNTVLDAMKEQKTFIAALQKEKEVMREALKTAKGIIEELLDCENAPKLTDTFKEDYMKIEQALHTDQVNKGEGSE